MTGPQIYVILSLMVRLFLNCIVTGLKLCPGLCGRPNKYDPNPDIKAY